MTTADRPEGRHEATAAKSGFVRIGDFFFRWRNLAFPLILLALFLGFRPAPAQFGSARAEAALDIIAALVVIAGLALRFATIGWAYIRRGGLKKKVHADDLVTTGYFALCRNPLYLGNMLIYAGIFLWHGHWVVILGGTALFFAVYSSLIAAEEHFLRAKFGAAFADYCARVPRWLPDLRRAHEATAGMQFSLKRSIVKDYTTIYNTLLSVIVIEVLDRYWWAEAPALHRAEAVAAGLILILTVAMVAVKIFKKRDFERSEAAAGASGGRV